MRSGNDPALRSTIVGVATVQAAIDEAVKRFGIVSDQFAVADELTPDPQGSQGHVLAKFAKETDQLYAARA